MILSATSNARLAKYHTPPIAPSDNILPKFNPLNILVNIFIIFLPNVSSLEKSKSGLSNILLNVSAIILPMLEIASTIPLTIDNTPLIRPCIAHTPMSYITLDGEAIPRTPQIESIID